MIATITPPTDVLYVTSDVNLFLKQLQTQLNQYSELENCSVTWEFFINELEYE